MKFFHRPISLELVLGVYFMSDLVLLMFLYPTAAHKLTCLWHCLVDGLLAVLFIARGLSAWLKH